MRSLLNTISIKRSTRISLKTLYSGFLSSILGIGCLGIGLVSSGYLFVPNANAAEQLSFRVSGGERSLAVADLRKLVNTGESSDTLKGLLDSAKLDPNVARGYLAASIDIKQYDLDVTVVDKFLNSYLIELLLQDIGKSIRPPGTDSASVGAIKSAIIASVADDSKISAIEFLEKYPTDLIIEVNGLTGILDRVSKDYANLAAPLQKFLQRVQMKR
jgi:hypothetical protein